MTGTRVVLAEDDVLLREGLASLLERSGFAIVGQAGDGGQLLPLVRETMPELVVVDIRMPPTHTVEGLDAARQIRYEFPETGILVLSAHADVEHAMELLASGRGIGYLLKSRITDVAEFLDTLERIAKGGSVVDPALVQELVSARRRDDPLAVLSRREHEVLALMAEGRSNAGIARRLWVTEGTVEKQVRSILGKLSLPETDDDHRRGLAVVAILDARCPGVRLGRFAEQIPDGVGRQGGLGQEPDRRARRDQVGVVLLGVGGDHDHGSWLPVRVVLESPGNLEATLTAEIDVDQRDIRSQLFHLPYRLGAGRGHANHRDALAVQQATGSVQEVPAIVDNQAAQHEIRMAGSTAGGIPATWTLIRTV
jgi:DNA-binding NarL/FixJ family response regulator